MILLGLAGAAGVGKDTVADYLANTYGFIKVAWADALREEVRRTFGLDDYTLMLDRSMKDVPHPAFAGRNCDDSDFVDLMQQLGVTDGREPHSPRQILQWWGSEYRRAQNPQYWIERLAARIAAIRRAVAYPEQKPGLFVIPDTRFENECDYVHDRLPPSGWATIPRWDGNVWHIRRDSVQSADAHQSARQLAVEGGERELWNNDTIARLGAGVDLLLRTSAKFVRVDPMLPDTEPVAADPEATPPPLTVRSAEDRQQADTLYAAGH